MGLTILAAVSLPIKFWAEAFINVVYVINVMPTTVLNKKNPYKMLFNEKPDYTKFLCLVVLVILSSRPYNNSCCLFSGYNLKNKGYICFSAERKTYISRHVVFNEQVFPYSKTNNPFQTYNSALQSSITNTMSLTILQSVNKSCEQSNSGNIIASHDLSQSIPLSSDILYSSVS